MSGGRNDDGDESRAGAEDLTVVIRAENKCGRIVLVTSAACVAVAMMLMVKAGCACRKTCNPLSNSCSCSYSLGLVWW